MPAEVAPAVLAWAAAHGRSSLPWRQTRDPWAVLVSELMLQQTQVGRVLEPWERFLARWPTVSACAAASVGDVVTAWKGLGYNSRAVRLHQCAGTVVQRHGGSLPQSYADLVALPGIGPYTARAVLAFAFEEDGWGVLDTNAQRVLSRLGGTAVTQAAADALVPPGKAWAWNQAVLDLGSQVCGQRSPACSSCPVSGSCAWFRAGRPEPDPAGPRSRQSTFQGSDRQGRGRLVDALRTGPVPVGGLAAAAGWPDDPERASRVAATLVADGLAVLDGSGGLRLP